MDAALSIALGYFVGSLSPSSLVGRVKKTDVRKSGTGNLGATNTMLVLGWGAGIFVMLFDLTSPASWRSICSPGSASQGCWPASAP